MRNSSWCFWIISLKICLKNYFATFHPPTQARSRCIAHTFNSLLVTHRSPCGERGNLKLSTRWKLISCGQVRVVGVSLASSSCSTNTVTQLTKQPTVGIMKSLIWTCVRMLNPSLLSGVVSCCCGWDIFSLWTASFWWSTFGAIQSPEIARNSTLDRMQD